MASFGVAALLFLASMICFGLLAVILHQWKLASTLDPLGLTTLLELSRSWTPAVKRTGIPYFAESYLRNRAIWLAVAGGSLALTYRRFGFAHHVATARRKRADAREEPALATAEAPIAVPRARRTFGAATRVAQLAAVVGESWRVILLGWGGLVMLALVALIVGTGPELIEHIGVPLVPVTANIATQSAKRGCGPHCWRSCSSPTTRASWCGAIARPDSARSPAPRPYPTGCISSGAQVASRSRWRRCRRSS